MLYNKDGSSGWGETVGTDDEGRFALGGLKPGEYVLVARTPDDLFGVLDAEVFPGSQAAHLVLVVAQPATLHLDYEGESKRVQRQVFYSGVAVAFEMLKPNERSSVVAPAGHVVARVSDLESGAQLEREVTLQPGVEKELVISFD